MSFSSMSESPESGSGDSHSAIDVALWIEQEWETNRFQVVYVLPDELWLSHILPCLSFREVCRVRQVCRKWACLAADNQLWRPLFSLAFPSLSGLPSSMVLSQSRGDDTVWYRYFADRYARSRESTKKRIIEKTTHEQTRALLREFLTLFRPTSDRDLEGTSGAPPTPGGPVCEAKETTYRVPCVQCGRDYVVRPLTAVTTRQRATPGCSYHPRLYSSHRHEWSCCGDASPESVGCAVAAEHRPDIECLTYSQSYGRVREAALLHANSIRSRIELPKQARNAGNEQEAT